MGITGQSIQHQAEGVFKASQSTFILRDQVQSGETTWPSSQSKLDHLLLTAPLHPTAHGKLHSFWASGVAPKIPVPKAIPHLFLGR